jgi:hypothetical protein
MQYSLQFFFLDRQIQSYDPGAATVIESIFSFNLSIPLNFLFDSFGGKILIVQVFSDIKKWCGFIPVPNLVTATCG